MKRIEHASIAIGIKRVQREVAASRISLPIAREGDLGMAAEGLDVAPERGHLERRAVGDHRDCAVLDPGRDRFQSSLIGERDHLLRRGGGGEIDLGDRQFEKGIAHGAADGARLHALAAQGIEHGLRRLARQPSRVFERSQPGLVATCHRVQSIVPGLTTPPTFSGG